MAASAFIDGLSNGTDGQGLRIMHADPHCIVADKPAGLLCVPGRGADKQDCLAARVQASFPDALVVHRLDMATSGLCLFARGPAMQRRFSRAFGDREVRKVYEAVAWGEPGAEGGEIDLPLRVDWPNRPMQRVDAEHGRPSLTRWRRTGPGPLAGTSRVQLEPVTGRTHQLRVHLQAIGHPIVGDALYAPPEAAAASPRLLLHACRLELVHPGSGEPVAWHSAVPF
jgi:tRNA pseudouridine32 synthase/23S rRNA pseudouridine746 synthase